MSFLPPPGLTVPVSSPSTRAPSPILTYEDTTGRYGTPFAISKNDVTTLVGDFLDPDSDGVRAVCDILNGAPVQQVLASQSILGLLLHLVAHTRSLNHTVMTLTSKVEAMAANVSRNGVAIAAAARIPAPAPAPPPAPKASYAAAAAGPAAPGEGKKKRTRSENPLPPPPTAQGALPAHTPSPPATTPVKKPTLPAAQRRFFAQRIIASPIEDSEKFAASLPIILARDLEANGASAADISLAFSVTINSNGTVTVLASPTTPATLYLPYFARFTALLNTLLPVKGNLYKSFVLAPTNVDFAIHALPRHALGEDNVAVSEIMAHAIRYASGAIISSARFLQNNADKRALKPTTTIVISVPQDQIEILGSSIRLFSRPRRIEKMFPSSPSTQCHNCCQFGHAAARCKSLTPVCPYCAGPHTRSNHRCGNPSCQNGGNSKSVMGCCTTIALKCANCGLEHGATSPLCNVKMNALTSRRPQPQSSEAMEQDQSPTTKE